MTAKKQKYCFRYCKVCGSKRMCWKRLKVKWQCWSCKTTKNTTLLDARLIMREKTKKHERKIKAQASQQSTPVNLKRKKELTGSTYLLQKNPLYKAWLERKRASKTIMLSPTFPPVILQRGKK